MNKKIAGGIVVGILFLASTNCFAASDEDYSLNSVRYYGPSSCQISDSTNRSTYIEKDILDDSPLAEWISQNYATVTSLAAEYGLPWEPIMAQGAIESNFGTSEAFEQRNNIFILGPDGNGLKKDASYPDIESSWRALFEYLRLKAGANRTRIFSEDAVRTPSLYIDAIASAGYNPALPSENSYIGLLKEYETEIEIIVERANLQSSKEILKNTLVMEANIERNRGEGIDKDGNSSEQTSFECNCGGDAIASNVRWSNFWISNNSLFGLQKAPVIGTEAEGRLSAKDYGLTIHEPMQGLAINFRIKNGNENIINDDPYAAYPSGDYPHFLVDIKKKRIFQYFPIALSAATEKNTNVEKGIVIDIVGTTDENDADSNYYLWNAEKITNAEWKYLATLVNAIYEESDSMILVSKETVSAQVWQKLSNYLNLTEHKATIKCSTMDDIDAGLSEIEAKRFVSYYNNSVSASGYSLPLNSKNMPASFVSYFVTRFTSLNVDDMAWGEPRDVAKAMVSHDTSLDSGNDPAPFAVFSSTDIGALCGGYNCGTTGIIMGINNGLATTIEQTYPSGKAEVKRRSLSELKNDKYGVSYVYLRSVLNNEELELGKVGR